MYFKKKIILSLVTITMLTSCSTEDKYRADECINCTDISNLVKDINSSSDTPDKKATEVKISFTHDKNNVTWQKRDIEEQTQGVALSTQNSVVYGKWDNRIIIIDPSTKTISDDKLYLDVEGKRYSSGEIPLADDVSGASEQILEKVLISESGTDMFSLLVKYNDESRDIGVGIYSDEIANGIPLARFARRDTLDANYYSYPTVKDMALSYDGTMLIAGGDDKKIKIFEPNNLNTPIEINVGKKIRSLNFSKNDEYIFVGITGLSKFIRIYNIATKEKITEIKTEKIPLSILELLAENKIVAIFQDSNKVMIYDVSDINNPIKSKLLIINGKAKSISISPDNKTFAISATGKQVNLFSIEGKENPKVITLQEECYGASFVSQSKLVVVGKTSMEFFDIQLEKQ